MESLLPPFLLIRASLAQRNNRDTLSQVYKNLKRTLSLTEILFQERLGVIQDSLHPVFRLGIELGERLRCATGSSELPHGPGLAGTLVRRSRVQEVEA